MDGGNLFTALFPIPVRRWRAFGRITKVSHSFLADFFLLMTGVLRQKITDIWTGVFSFLTVKMFFAFLGVIYAFLLRTVNSNLIRLKGLIFGVALWFFIYTFIGIFKISNLDKIQHPTVISHLIEAAVYGYFLGWFLQWLDRKAAAL